MESLKNSDAAKPAEVASAAAAAAAKSEAARKNMDFIAKNLLAGGECLFSIRTQIGWLFLNKLDVNHLRVIFWGTTRPVPRSGCVISHAVLSRKQNKTCLFSNSENIQLFQNTKSVT